MDALTRLREVHAGQPPGDPWLIAARAAGLARLDQTGIPSRSNEDWKYTNAARLLATPWVPRAPEPLEALPDAALVGEHLVVLVDGVFEPRLSRLGGLPAGAAIGPVDGSAGLGRVLGEGSGFDALGAAFLAGGAVLAIGEGVAVEQPVHLVHVATGGARLVGTRVVVRLGVGARAALVEHWVGLGSSLTTAVTEVSLGAGSELAHVRLQDEHAEAGHHVGTVAAEIAGDATLRSLVVTLGAAVSRLDLRVRLVARGAEAHLDGLYLLRGQQHADHHLHVDHAAAHTTSRQHYKGILDGSARGVFTGRVVVRKDAQKIDSAQANHNLLLSEDAVVNSRPQLEILADDVKCAHGVAIGRLDPEAAFYLRSRGLDEAATRSLLTSAYAHEVLVRLPQAALRSALEARVAGWLAGP